MNGRKVAAEGIALVILAALFVVVGARGAMANPAEVVYDDFNDGTPGTNIGGAAGMMSYDGAHDPTFAFTSGAGAYEGAYALSLTYNFPENQWVGYWSFFNADESGHNVSSYTDIRMWVKGAAGGGKFKVELKDTLGNVRAVYITLAPGFENGVTTSWQELVMPLYNFAGVDMSQVKQMNFVFDVAPYTGTVCIDNIVFTDISPYTAPPSGLIVDDFNDGRGPNNLGGGCGTMYYQATIEESYVQNSYEGLGALKLVYNFRATSCGNWCGYWSFLRADEGGYNISSHTDFRMWVKGTVGGEKFRVELKDTANNTGVKFVTVSGTSYSEVVIPLSDFSGVDMTNVKQINIVFGDFSPTSGTVYFDLIRFTGGPQPPVAVIATTPSPASGPAPLTVNFDASGSYDPDGTIVSYSWNFGDGNTGSGVTTSRTYSVGSYTATLTVTDDDGLTDTATVLVSATAEDTVVSISPASREVVGEEDFTVDVQVTPGTAIAGVQFDLRFNPTLVSVTSVTEGDLLNQGGASTHFQVLEIDNENGHVQSVAGAITTPGATVSSPGIFATVHMKGKMVEGTSQLLLENVIVGDSGGHAVPITVENGAVTVIPYQDWDVNCDNQVNVLDMIIIGQHLAETETPHWIRADVNRDGAVNVLDMILVGQHWTG